MAAIAALLPIPAFAGGGWVNFHDETSARLIASDPSLGLNDTEEKDFAVGDVDHDGDDDLVVVRKQIGNSPGKRVNVLFINENGVLTDRTAEFIGGFLTPTNDRDVVLVDLDGDTWLDIVTAPAYGVNDPANIANPRIYMNQGAPGGVWLGFVLEFERAPSVPDHSNFCGVAAGDVDNDGDIDLYFVDYDAGGFDNSFEDQLWINDGSGFFSDETASRIPAAAAESVFATACEIVDTNGDGWPELLKSEAGPMETIQNDGTGYFDTWETTYNGAAYFFNTFDLNNDGKLDYYIPDDAIDRYGINTGNGPDGYANYVEYTAASSTDGFGSNSTPGDLNKDGFTDIIVGDVDVQCFTCVGTPKVLRNTGISGPGNLVDTTPLGFDTPHGMHDVAIMDLDGDTWPDLVFGTCTGYTILINEPPFGIVFTYPQGLPTFLDVGQPTELQVGIEAIGDDTVNADSPTISLSIDGGPFETTPLVFIGDDVYMATLPAAECLTELSFYMSATLDQQGITITDPPGAPDTTNEAIVALGTEAIIVDQIEGDVSQWSVVNDILLTSGAWAAVEPVGTQWNGLLAAPAADATNGDGNVMAFVTENGVPGGDATASDVDGGPTHLISPSVDLSGTDGTILFAHWVFSVPGTTDKLEVAVSNDDGRTWVPALDLSDTMSSWRVEAFKVSDYVRPTASVRVRFSITDIPNDSITEAGIDNFTVEALICEKQADIQIVSATPANNTRDARQPSEPDGSNVDGWQSIEIQMDADASALTAGDFAVSHTDEDTPPPTIVDLTAAANTVVIELSDTITVGHWTTIAHTESGTSTRMGYLPADVNEDGTSAAGDVLDLIDSLNGVTNLPLYKTDIDRSGEANASDILREIDLLNGAGAYAPGFLGMTLPE